jgi:hypothetical protein
MLEFGYHREVLTPEKVKELHASITREIFDFTVAFVLNHAVCGSGTLVRSNGKFGVLTATHVLEQFAGSKKQRVGLIISENAHQFILEPDHVERSDFLGAIGDEPSTGPDISFLQLLSPTDESNICARKSVYLIDGRSFSKFDGFPVKDGSWWIAGAPDQKSESEGAGAQNVLKATLFVGEGRFVSIVDSTTYDLIRVAMIAGNHTFPDNYEGVSGGGIWISCFTMDPDEGKETVGYDPPFLAGVAFYQTAIDTIAERTIVGHGPSSIYGRKF